LESRVVDDHASIAVCCIAGNTTRHLGNHLLIRQAATRQKQQRLVLGRRPCRSRLRGIGFHALALARRIRPVQ